MQYFEADGEKIAILATSEDCKSGYNFLSESNWGLQVGINVYHSGQTCEAHEHIGKTQNELQPLIGQAMEMLHVLSGSCSIKLYWREQETAHVTLKRGDTIFLIKGGHSLEFNDDTRILECKQGPYFSRERDKRFYK